MEDYNFLLESKNYGSISNLTFNNEKMVLPYNSTQKYKGSLVYSINNDIESLSKLLSNKQGRILNIGKIYNAYYYDFRSYRALKSDVFKVFKQYTDAQAKKDRILNYEEISSEIQGIKTPVNINSLNGLNILYDLQPMINVLDRQQLITKKSKLIQLKIFFDAISKVINTQYEMAVNLDNYNKTIILCDLDHINKYLSYSDNHILLNLLLLLKKSNKIIDKFKYDFKVLFYSSIGYFIFDMKENLNKESLTTLKRLIKRLKSTSDIIEKADTIEKKEMEKLLVKKLGFTGEEDIDLDEISSSDSIIKKLSTDDEEIKSDASDEPIEIDNELETLIEADPELKKKVYNTLISSSSKPLSKRDELLREKQKDLKLKTHTLEELKNMSSTPVIETHEITNKKITTTNPNIKKVKFTNFEKTYMENLYEKNVASAFTKFNDTSIKMNIIKIDVKDTSDALNFKETYDVTYEDEFRRRHNIKVDLPKFIDNKFLFINGNKKIMDKQLFSKPVIKIAPDTVQLCSNYNKIFIRRIGTKYSPSLEKFKKLVTSEKHADIISYKRSDNSIENTGYLTLLEYDELAKYFSFIDIKIDKDNILHLVFNMKYLENIFKEKNIKYTENTLDNYIIGYIENTKSKTIDPLYYCTDSKKNSDGLDLVFWIMSMLPNELRDNFKSLSSGTKYTYTSATLMAKKIPVIVLISFFEGLSTVIKKFNSPDIQFVDKKDKGDHYIYIRFKDGYLSYPMSNTEACILFNGLLEYDTKNILIADMDSRDTYLDIFDKITGSSYIAGGLINFYDFMIDDITKRVLEIFDYPTDLVELVIYASNLLADSQYLLDIDMVNYRIRSNEVVPCILYKQLANAYSSYRKTAYNPHPTKMSVEQNCVIRELSLLCSVKDYDELGPLKEEQACTNVSMKGYVGMNLDEAYTQQKRSYHKSMVGIIGISTDNGPNCGKIKHLVAEPTVNNALGIIEITPHNKISELKDINLETSLEMQTPFSTRHDDPNRVAMLTKQDGHVVPVTNSSHALISTGMDEIIHYRTGNSFSIVARADGKVVDYNEELEIVTIEYTEPDKDGNKVQFIDLSKHIDKNGGGGFFNTNRLITKLKKGDKFKQDDILAYNPLYYDDLGIFGVRLKIGSLQKVVFMSNGSTYEDSTFTTYKGSKDMATEMTKIRTVVLGKNSNVEYIIEEGSAINIGEELIRFDESENEPELNELLATIRQDFHEQIKSIGKSKIKSHYTGTVESIDIYCTVPLDELSPSLRKVVSKYQKKIKDRVKYLDNYSPNTSGYLYRNGVLMNKPDSQVKSVYGKIKGIEVGEGVLIEFAIKFHDEMTDGDKVASWGPNKSTIGYVIPKGYEPYTISRPYEEITFPIAPSAVLQRSTNSIILTGCIGKVLVELKRSLYKILTNEDWNEYQKRIKEAYENTEIVTEDYTPYTKYKEKIDTSETKLLEETFDLQYNYENNTYISKEFHPGGDIIMALYPVDKNTNIKNSSILSNFNISNDINECNVFYDKSLNLIKSLKPISKNDILNLYIN